MEITQQNTENANWQQQIADIISMASAAKSQDERRQAASQLSLAGCIALKAGETVSAKACLDKLLAMEWTGSDADVEDEVSVYLEALQNLLAAVAKKRSETLFYEWLDAAQIKISDIISDTVNSQKIAEFLLTLTFIVCDRRFTSCFSLNQILVQQFILHGADKAERQKFLDEWTNLTAQFARRKWADVSSFLLNTLLKIVLRIADKQLMGSVMLRLNMHMAMYSRWDGFENAFGAYKNLQLFFLIVLRRAESEKCSEEERRQYLLVTLRSLRDLAGNVARGNMQEDLDIFRKLDELLKKNLPQNLHKEARRLVQLAIAYWSLTKPKTSRRQLEYLADLLNPCLIDDKLQKIVQSLG